MYDFFLISFIIFIEVYESIVAESEFRTPRVDLFLASQQFIHLMLELISNVKTGSAN